MQFLNIHKIVRGYEAGQAWEEPRSNFESFLPRKTEVVRFSFSPRLKRGCLVASVQAYKRPLAVIYHFEWTGIINGLYTLPLKNLSIKVYALNIGWIPAICWTTLTSRALQTQIRQSPIFEPLKLHPICVQKIWKNVGIFWGQAKHIPKPWTKNFFFHHHMMHTASYIFNRNKNIITNNLPIDVS